MEVIGEKASCETCQRWSGTGVAVTVAVAVGGSGVKVAVCVPVGLVVAPTVGGMIPPPAHAAKTIQVAPPSAAVLRTRRAVWAASVVLALGSRQDSANLCMVLIVSMA